MTKKMNQITHFEFIVRNLQIIFVSFWLLATPLIGKSCVAQDFDQRPQTSRWIRREGAANGSQPPASVVFGRPIAETSFSQLETPPQSQTVRQAELPTADHAHSTLSNITHFLSNQTKKLFGNNAPGSGPDFKRIFGSLSLVLGCYFVLVWVLRMISPPSNKPLPNDVVEVLGKTPFGHRQHLQLVRIGSRLLLLLENNETIQPIAEVSDPEEVYQLLTLCGPKTREHRRKRSSSTRPGLSEAQILPQVHSFRLPAVGAADTECYSNEESEQASLAKLIRVFENATGKKSSRYKNSYEA
jgi:flagellar biogenesis protein FliO